MNKLIVISLVCISVNSFIYAAGASYDQLSMLIVSTHTLVFGKDNLLTERIKPEESNKWYDVIKEIRTYVKTNVPTSTLNKDVDVLWQASADLLNTIKELHATEFSKKPLSFKKDVVEKKLASLHAKQEQLKKILSNRDKAPFFEKSVHKDAREVVKKCALFLDVTYEKLFNDWARMIASIK